jgi:NAD(P)-dependent dehydrogenase (short-subunit alcohol dehydrogenase family)
MPGNGRLSIPLLAATLACMTTNDSHVWLITGSSAGFGQAIARAALARGDQVVATARRPVALEDLVSEAPDRVLALSVDVTRPETGREAVAKTLDRFGRLDVLVNNAGYGTVGAVEEVDSSDLRTVMETMFFGPVALTQAVLPHMRSQGSGAIVQMSSMGGQVTAPGFGAYCAAKFALEAISESLAAEVEAFGIRVLIVEPGAFRTEFGGARMHRSREIEAYAETVGPTRASIDAMDGTQHGDPDKAAAAIVAALATPEPPLRLALGEDAVSAIGATLARRRGDLAAWQSVSLDTRLGR